MPALYRGFASVVLAVATAVAALVAAAPVQAYNYRDASAGGVCHGASGASSTLTFNLQFLTNVGTTDQYVICNLGNDDLGSWSGPVRLSAYFRLPTAGSTVTCTAQIGSWYDGVTHVRSSQSQTYTSSGPNANVTLTWDHTTLVRYQPYEVLMLNCKLPPGAQMGLIEHWGADPV
jgi:hypothetical protein